MKILSIAIALSVTGSISLPAQTPTVQSNIPVPTAYAITTRDANSQVWQRTTYETGPDGKAVPRIHKYTELATGLNHLVAGQWVASDETITILPDGTAAAVNGQHHAYFPSDIYNGEIKLVTPDGKVLQSQPVGLSYDDGSNTVLIAVLTNSIGQLVSSNQIVYPNAFNGINADLRYTYTIAGFEQDVILHEQPPAPATLGLNPDTTQLQVMTEFFNPPPPVINVNRLQTVAGEMPNDQLTFGAMQMVQGKAFSMGTNSSPVPVNKQWTQIGGRQFLVEEVPMVAMADDLENLPPPASQTQIVPLFRVASGHLILPTQHLVKMVPALQNQPVQLAEAALPKHGLVLDYQMLNSSLTNYTFQGDATYYISGSVYLYGTNSFEGGTVIKYAAGASLNVNYPDIIQMLTATYRPALFTAIDDDSVGQPVSGSTGTPTNYYANPAIYYGAGSSACSLVLENFRINYAAQAISVYGGAINTILKDAQIVNCQEGFYTGGYGSDVYMENMLLANIQDPFVIALCNVYAKNVTFIGIPDGPPNYQAAFLEIPSGAYNTPNTLNFINCIFVNFELWYNGSAISLSGNNNGFYNNDLSTFGTLPVTVSSNPFQTIGGGSYYLTNGCGFHNAGTANIDPALLADLAIKTTYPPLDRSGVTISTNLTLSPQAPRDTNSSPDLGYHYDPIDYVVGETTLGNNTVLHLTAGTALGWYRNYWGGAGLWLSDGAQLDCTGTAISPCQIVHYSLVQEGNGGWDLADTGWGAAVMLNGDDSANVPQLNCQFTHWSDINFSAGYDSRDYWAYGTASLSDCEFYNANITSYEPPYYFTNCLFSREIVGFGASDNAASFVIQNCTFYNGCLTMDRYSGQSVSFWSVKNTAFDGTAFDWNDNYSGNTNYTAFDYNAYNTNNLNWQTYAFNSPNYGTLETVGAHDLMTTNYNWQSSWFGDFYLPPNSPLINMGSTTADQVGLYHFTTQTNQTVEGTSPVDIGYHYVATDAYGNPLDTNGDGIADYLEDANGNGVVDNGETNWALAILTQPSSQNVTVGDDTSFTVLTAGINPDYSWYFNGTNLLAGATNATLMINDVTTNNVGNYSVVVSGIGSITSSPALLTVQVPQYAVPYGLLTNFVFQSDTTYYINTAVTLAGTTTIEGGSVIKFATNGNLNVLGPLICKTAPYRPALLTAADDNSAGAGIDTSTGIPSGYYDAAPINICSSSNVIHDLRMTYLNYGLCFYTNMVELDNIQAVSCNVPILLNSANLTINNALFYNIGDMAIEVNGGTAQVSGIHLTVHNCAVFANAAQLSLTNSLMVNITNLLSGGGTLATNFTAILNNDDGIFQTAAYGNHYLAAGSPYRNDGTTNLSFQVLTNIAAKTTYPPVVIEETNIANNIVFSQQAQRDVDVPDLGYHYDPVDYVIGGVDISGGNVAVYPGTVLGIFGTSDQPWGIRLDTAFMCEGLPTNWNRIVACNVVQEAANTNWIDPVNGLISDDASFNYDALLDCRFTDWSVLAQDAPDVNISQKTTAFLRDCQFHGGSVGLNYVGATSRTDSIHPMFASDPSFNNCLFERVNFSLMIGDSSSSYILDNLFLGGTFNYQPESGYAVVQNNLFDRTTIPDNSAESETYISGYNAYVTNCDRLQPTSITDVVLTNEPVYQAGPLGCYYQSATSWLINAGSTNADALGLYDYTVQTNLVGGSEIKETNSVVDIGYHYVAVDASGNPISTYTNGLPDYLVTSSTGLIPDWWEFEFFGNLDEATTADYDSDGTNVLTEYSNGIDPNKISFSCSFLNQYVSTNVVTGNITILGGIPSNIALLVDNTNFATATWTAFNSSNVTVSLGSTQGSHDVWIGLRGLLSDTNQTWQETTLILDTNPPTITITNPVNNTSFNAARVNIGGNFSAVSLQQITVNGIQAFVNGTNYEALNVPLVAGSNTIVAVIQDLTGMTNTTSININGLTNSDGSMDEPVLLQATPVAGFAPLSVTFSIQTNYPGTLQQVAYDFNGDGIADLITNNLDAFTYTYSTNGEYFPVVTIQTTVGQFSSIGGWNAAAVDPSNQPVQINVQAALTQTVFASITDPVALKWTGTNLYVLSGSGATITEYCTNGSTMRTLSGLGVNPSGFDVDAAGNIYVAITSSNQVWRFIPTNSSYIADTNFGTGGFIGDTNGMAGTTNGGFNAPFGVALSPDGGSISVSDSGNDRIEQFSTNGTFIVAFGTNGTDIGEFNMPEGLTYDSDGILYITDSGNNRIVLSQFTGVIGVTGTNGTALGQFNAPVNISVGQHGVYVADTGNNRIQKFDISPPSQFSITPSSIGYAVSTSLNDPAAVAAVDNLTNETFYVADTGNNRIIFYTLAVDDPTPAWTNMAAHIAAGDISGAMQYFSSLSADEYYQDFLNIGTANVISAVNQIGTLTPVFINDDKAEYYFTNSINGQILTFPVEFGKENGVWKILEY